MVVQAFDAGDGQSTQTTVSSRKYIDVIKSENDKRLYRYVILENDLRLLLVSDDTTEKSAVSVDIHAGHLLDPVEVPGIAHFCEHMLFLGTTKYPVENDFSDFLAKNGGHSNAYTNAEHTNYYFDVNSEQLPGAVDRFAQFFLCPLFDADSTDRELNAIDSEHQKNILLDMRRIYYINKVTSKPGHVYQKFGTGNLETLKTIPAEKNIDIRKLLLDFHSKYYSANIITVAAIGKDSLDNLEKLLAPLFSEVVNKNTSVPVYEEHPFGQNELGVAVHITSVKEMKKLKIYFPIPDTEEYYKEKPFHYISHLIGHEGKGSLLSLLKKKAWVNSLSAGPSQGGKGFAFFMIDLDLTEDGMKKVNEILGMVFQYINLLKQQPPKEWVFKEMKMLDEMRFRFKGKESPTSYASCLTKYMHCFPGEDVIYGPYVLDKFDPQLITDLLKKLHPENFRYVLATQTFDKKPDVKVKYYDAEYSIQPIDKHVIQQWINCGVHEELYLPDENLFVPNDLAIKVKKDDKEVKNVPTLLKDTELIRVWYKADDTFYLPKSCVNLMLYCPASNTSPYSLTQLATFIYLLKDELNEYAYDAELAGIDYSVCATNFGILIQISGYNDKQPILLAKILEKLISLDIKKERFLLALQKIEEVLRNSEVYQPYRQIRECSDQLLEERVWTDKEQLESLKDVTFEGLKLYMKEVLHNVYIECLICGNIALEECHQLVATLEKNLFEVNQSKQIFPLQHIYNREFRLPEGCSYLFEKRSSVHTISCVMVYLQVGLQEMAMNAMCELFASMFQEPCFDTLRTKEQLGYIVGGGIMRSTAVQGIKVIVQSDKSPAAVEERIDQFLASFEETLLSMDDAKFKSFIDALAVRKLEKPKRLKQEFLRYTSEIISKQYHFRRAAAEVEELRKLQKNDILHFYKKYISPLSKERKKLAVVVLGKDAKSLTEDELPVKKAWQVIDDIVPFKAQLEVYPLILPYNGVPLIATNTKSKL